MVLFWVCPNDRIQNTCISGSKIVHSHPDKSGILFYMLHESWMILWKRHNGQLCIRIVPLLGSRFWGVDGRPKPHSSWWAGRNGSGMCLCGISINAKRLAVSLSFAWGLFSYSQQGEVSRDPSSGAICTHELRLLWSCERSKGFGREIHATFRLNWDTEFNSSYP